MSSENSINGGAEALNHETHYSGEFPGFLARILPDRHHRIARFLLGIMVEHRLMVFLWLGANVLSGFLEGVSMSLVYLSVSVLMSDGGNGIVQNSQYFIELRNQLTFLTDKYAAFLILVVLVAVAQILQSGFFYAGYALSSVIRMRVRRSLMNDIVQHIMDMNFQMISRYKSGELWTYVSLGKSIEKLIGQINEGIYTIFMALAYLAVLMWISWAMTFGALLIFALLSVGLKSVMNKIHEHSNNNLTASRKINNTTAELLPGMRVIRSFGAEKKALNMFKKIIHESSICNMRVSLWSGAISPIVDTVTFVTLALIMVGLSLVFAERIEETLPTFLIFIYIIARLMPRLGYLNNIRAAIYNAWPAVSHTVEFLRRDDKQMDRKGGVPFTGLEDKIEFRNVSLHYMGNERDAVKNISFSVPRGGSFAIVGESGSGKSTIVDLFLGLFDPTEGQILIDGIPLSEMDIESWRQKIGVVSQETFLFADTIRNNIQFSNDEASEDEIINASKIAYADDFISKLENGYETMLGDRGFRLSGGQRQRLALARAMLRDPDVIILDEATSDLDSQSEYFIQQALQRFGKDKTVITVAHRLSTIRNSDKIIVMKEGGIIESGTHESLVAEGGVYASLWMLQSNDEKPNLSA